MKNFKIFQKNITIQTFLKINVPRFLEIHGPWIFRNSWSMYFLEFMVQGFLEIQCPTIFCDFGLFNRLAQAGGGGPYYMIFYYQKHTVLNYYITSYVRNICMYVDIAINGAHHLTLALHAFCYLHNRKTSLLDTEYRTKVRSYIYIFARWVPVNKGCKTWMKHRTYGVGEKLNAFPVKCTNAYMLACRHMLVQTLRLPPPKQHYFLSVLAKRQKWTESFNESLY